MDGLLRSVGDALTGLFAGAFDAIGGALRGAVGQVEATVPIPLLLVLVFGGLLGAAWFLAKR